jgi:hypothetical protein
MSRVLLAAAVVALLQTTQAQFLAAVAVETQQNWVGGARFTLAGLVAVAARPQPLADCRYSAELAVQVALPPRLGKPLLAAVVAV